MVGPPYDADNSFGWTKLMAGIALRAYHRDFGMKLASCRLFAVYGERESIKSSGHGRFDQET